MADAERKKLDEELAERKRQLAEFRAQREGVAQGRARYLRIRGYWKGRSQQVQAQIMPIEARRKAESPWTPGS